MTNIRFIIATYGNRYLGMLLTCLFSVKRSNPYARISVFWDDVSSAGINILSNVFPEVEFIRTDQRIDDNDRIKRISSKTRIWEHAVRQKRNECLCLLDADTVVIRDIQHYYNYEFDVAFTCKNEQYPINTGVLLCKANQGREYFFKKWNEMTMFILNDSDLFAQANDSRLHYGGADQMSLFQMISYRCDKGEYDVVADNKSIIKLKAFPCEELNETRSCPIGRNTHIIHYKGGWQAILLSGKNFTKNRPKKKSWSMYLTYLSTYSKALEFARQQGFDEHHVARNCQIYVPPYLCLKDLKERKISYLIHYMKNNIQDILSHR